jgi:hypothetical protein
VVEIVSDGAFLQKLGRFGLENKGSFATGIFKLLHIIIQINSLLSWCKSSAEVFGGRRAGDRRYTIGSPSGMMNPGSLLSGVDVFFLREEQPRVD